MKERGHLWWAGTIIGAMFGALFGYVVGWEEGRTVGAVVGVILGIPVGAVIGPYLMLILVAVGGAVLAPLALVGLALYVAGLAILDLFGRLRR